MSQARRLVVVDDGTPITISRPKADVTSKVGLRLNLNKQKRLVVTKISPESIFADCSELTIGMLLLSVNGLDVSDISAEEATGLIKRIKGNVTIVVEKPPLPVARPPTTVPAVISAAAAAPPPSIRPVTVTRVKQSPSDRVGLRLGHADDDNPDSDLMITKMAPDSLFADSPIQTGMKLLAINGLEMQGFSAQDATNLVKRCVGSVTLVAVAAAPPAAATPVAQALVDVPPVATTDTSSSPQALDNGSTGHGSVAESTGSSSSSSSSHHRHHGGGGDVAHCRQHIIRVVKQSAQQRVGLSLQQEPSGGEESCLVVTRVDPAGLLGGQGLVPGMRLVSVNNVSCRKLSVPLVKQMISRIAGELTLVVQEPPTLPPAVVAPVLQVLSSTGSVAAAPAANLATPAPAPTMTTLQQDFAQITPIPVSPPTMTAVPAHVAPPPPPHNKMITAIAFRATPQTRVGIRLRCRADGSIRIEDVATDGLFRGTNLRAGLTLARVNDVPCRGMAHEAVLRLIGQTVGPLKLEATADE